MFNTVYAEYNLISVIAFNDNQLLNFSTERQVNLISNLIIVYIGLILYFQDCFIGKFSY